MRKILIALLLASAFAPAAAYAQDEGYERGVRAETERSERASQREKAREARSQRVDRVERSEPARFCNSNAASALSAANRIRNRLSGGRVDRIPRAIAERAERPARTDRADRDPQPVQQVEQPAIAQPVQQSRGRSESLVDGFRQIARDGTIGRDNDHDDRDWSHDWRKDKRYDWWHYRSRYSSLYRLGRYSDPYGWDYRRWAVGLQPVAQLLWLELLARRSMDVPASASLWAVSLGALL